MKILHVMAPGGIGGLEQVAGSLASGHRKTGHDVTVAAVLSRAGKPLPSLEALRECDVRVVPLHLPPRAYLRERAEISRLCVEFEPDVVHMHGYRPDVVDSGVARAHRIPTVTTVHGFTGDDFRSLVYRRLQRVAFRRIDAVVAVSRSVAGKLRDMGIPQGRIHTIQNAWAEHHLPLNRRMARRSLGIPEDEFVVGWVGRLGHEKGADLLLKAMPYLADLPLSLSIIGDGPERAFLHERLKKHEWKSRVRWHGVVPDAGRFFSAFDAFALTSRSEGTPIVLFEAMAGIVPIVATAVGGVPDMLSDREALLIPPENPSEIAQAIRTIFRSPGAARARAHASHHRLNRDFAHEPWLAEYEDLYRSIGSGCAAEPPAIQLSSQP